MKLFLLSQMFITISINSYYFKQVEPGKVIDEDDYMTKRAKWVRVDWAS
jgi:hypothetical protein